MWPSSAPLGGEHAGALHLAGSLVVFGAGVYDAALVIFPLHFAHDAQRFTVRLDDNYWPMLPASPLARAGNLHAEQRPQEALHDAARNPAAGIPAGFLRGLGGRNERFPFRRTLRLR